MSAHQPACSSPGQKVTKPISRGHTSDFTVCSKPPKFGKVLLAAEASHVCAVKGHSGLLSWMEAVGDITSLFQCLNSLGSCWQPTRSIIKFARTSASSGAAKACPNPKEGFQTTGTHSSPALPHKRLEGTSKLPPCFHHRHPSLLGKQQIFPPNYRQVGFKNNKNLNPKTKPRALNLHKLIK